MANQFTILGRPALADQKFTDIHNHIMDPQKYPLPAGLEDQYKRVVTAAQLLDDYPEDRHVIKLLQVKYPGNTLVTLRADVNLARMLFKSQHTFDYDFWLQWRIKDVLDLLRRAKLHDNLKMWNEAHKTLIALIGEKPEASEDPRRMERNVFFIQINNGTGQPVSVPLDKIKSMNSEELGDLLREVDKPINDAQADKLFES